MATNNRLVNKIQSQIPNASSGSLSNIQIPDVSSIISQATGSINEVVSSASNVLNSSLSSLASSFPTSVSSLFGNVNKNTSSLTNISGDIFGKKETDTLVKTLASGTSGAIATPVSFITKPITDSIKGTDTLSSTAGIQGLLNGASESISNISKATGTSISSISELTKSISSVTNELSSSVSGIIGNVSSSVTGLVSGINAPVVSSITQFSNGLMNGIHSTVSTITTPVSQVLGSVTNITNSIKGVNNTILAALPAELRGMVGGFTNSLISNTIDKYITNNVKSLQGIIAVLNGVTSTNNLTSYYTNLLNSKNGNTYGVTNNVGTDISKLVGGNSADIVNGLYGTASGLCGNISAINAIDSANNKDLYDILLQLATDLGMNDLLKQLTTCSSTSTIATVSTLDADDTSQSVMYYDERSVELLQSKTSEVALKGDIDTYVVLQEVLGSSNIKCSKTDAITIGTNMRDTKENISSYKQVLNNFDYTGEDLLTSQIDERTVISGPVTLLMTSSGTTFVDEVLGKEDRALVQGAMLLCA